MLPRNRVLVLLLSIGLGVLYKEINKHLKPLPLPNIPLHQYWGEGEAPPNYTDPTKLQLARPFFADDVIEELSDILGRNVTFTEPLEDVNFEYGFNTDYLKELVKYWKDNYLTRWREREIFIWQYPHYTTDIDGLRLHYNHLKVYDDVKEVKTMYPILLLHGWPSTFREFFNINSKLYSGDDDSNFVFDIVVPSLPGFGWSQGAQKKGMGPAQVAVILRNLMVRIGYTKFFIHGNDMGSVIGSHIATLFPENVLGFHSTMCTAYTPLSVLKLLIASQAPSFFVTEKNKDFFFPLSQSLTSVIEETGYFHLQGTKPDTIGAALTANPVGLAAYILEKYSTWTNATFKSLKNGGLTKRYKLDTLLDTVMIYYLTNSIGTSTRLHAEALSKENLALNLDRVPTNVPTACARFKGALPHHHALDFQLKDKYKNLVQSTFYRKGGHFPALEQPNTLYADIIDFVKKVQPYIK